MTHDTNLQFIEAKLQQTSNAIMYTMTSTPERMPNDIVTFLKVDDLGQLWFTARKTKYNMTPEEHSFPMRLFFYRKGNGFYIEMSGVALYASKDELTGDYSIDDETILLKTTPSMIEYTETARKQVFPGLVKWYTTVTSRLQEKISFLFAHKRSISEFENI